VWMRPPFGYRGPHLSPVVRRVGFRGVVMWSRGARDWRPQPIADMVHRLRRVRGGDIVLLHDGDHRRLRGDRNITLAALDYWLPMWISAGLQFVTLDDIAGRPAAEANESSLRRGGPPCPPGPGNTASFKAEAPVAPLHKTKASGS
jgi:peptidoglycan/xylan/chitin deacetylase (PgdA/CDA1 family)